MIEYELIRRKRKRITLSVQNGKLTVIAPVKAPQGLIDEFISLKESWINQKIANFYLINQKYIDIINYHSVLYLGKTFILLFTGGIKNFDFSGDNLLVPLKYKSETAELQNKKLQRGIVNYMKNLALKELKEQTDKISGYMQMPYGEFALTNAKGKWGSCDPKNNIMLNWRLLMLDNKYIEYVIIHELCHTYYHNHSQKFWKTVEKFYPDYKNVRKKLKEKSIIINLFR